MIISAPTDYRDAARRKLPPFLFYYIDGGVVTEQTMHSNNTELSQIALRQRVLTGVGEPSLTTKISGANGSPAGSRFSNTPGEYSTGTANVRNGSKTDLDANVFFGWKAAIHCCVTSNE